MTDTKIVSFRDIKFTRDTKVNYKDGNTLINTIFKQYDKDLSGDFNDKEFENYLKTQERIKLRREEIQQACNSTTKYYDEKLSSILIKYEEVDRESERVILSVWDDLIKFEENHPEVSRLGLDGEILPEGAYEYDISAFQMGIFDEKNNRYTGKIYKKGYLLGLEKLSKEDKEKYLQLLERAKAEAIKGAEVDKKYSELNKEYDKYKKLLDFANNGYLQNVISDDLADKICILHDACNPFYEQIKELEKEKQRLWLIANRNEEENLQLEKCQNELETLYNASNEWSIADTGINLDSFIKLAHSIGIKDIKELSFQYNEIENLNLLGKFSYALNNNPDNKKDFSISSALQTIYQDEEKENYKLSSKTAYDMQKYMIQGSQSFGIETQTISANIGETITVSSKEEKNGEEKKNSHDKRDVLNSENKTINYTTTLNAGYNKEKFSTNLQASLTTGNSSDETGLNYNITATTNYKIGKFNNSAQATFTSSGNSYQVSNNANFNEKFGKNFTFTASPSLNNSYNSGAKSYYINPTCQMGLKYQKKDFSAELSANEQFDATFKKGTKTEFNHNLTITNRYNYKGFSSALKFNDKNSSSEHSNNYGLELGYNFKKWGQIGLEYTKNILFNKKDNQKKNEESITVKYTLNY